MPLVTQPYLLTTHLIQPIRGAPLSSDSERKDKASLENLQH